MKYRAAILSFSWIVLAQDQTIRVDVTRVLLHATVKDKDGGYIRGLEKENFAVTEDGRPTPVKLFYWEDTPVAVGIVIDNSGSMRNKRSQVISAASAFVGQSQPGDEMFVLHFNRQLRWGLSGKTFSSDRADLRAALDSLKPEDETALYDALWSGIRRVEESQLVKKTLLVISDGGDNASTRKGDEIVELARKAGAIIYSVGIFDEFSDNNKPQVLRRLAQETGGIYYAPEKIEELQAVCESIAKDLKNQYTIGIEPHDTVSGKYHKLQVRATDKGGRKLTVRARTGYQASMDDAR